MIILSTHIERRFLTLKRSLENGQALVEYALILLLVAIIVVVLVALLGPEVGKTFSNVVTAL